MNKIAKVLVLRVCFVLCLLAAGPRLAAADAPVPPVAAPVSKPPSTGKSTNTPTASTPTNAPLKQLQQLINRINTKLAAGQRTEAELAGEMKEFDALLAEHRQEKTEEVAQIVWMKAMLHIQVWDDMGKGKKLLQQLKTDFPQSKFAAQADQVFLNELIVRINAKVAAGERAETNFAGELKEFDALLAAHPNEKTDEVARILWMKAMVYLQGLMDLKKGRELLDQVKRDFPKSQFAAQADRAFASMEQSLAQIEMMKKMQEESRKFQEGLGIVVGAKFPDFDEKDVAGQPISLARYKGKIVLLDFWATWCGPCIGELPNVLATYAKYHASGFEIVGISRDQDEQKLKSFIAERQMPWPQYFDGRDKLATKYGISSIPTTFLVDGTGTLIARDLRGGELEKAVAAALGKK